MKLFNDDIRPFDVVLDPMWFGFISMMYRGGGIYRSWDVHLGASLVMFGRLLLGHRVRGLDVF